MYDVLRTAPEREDINSADSYLALELGGDIRYIIAYTVYIWKSQCRHYVRGDMLDRYINGAGG